MFAPRLHTLPSANIPGGIEISVEDAATLYDTMGSRQGSNAPAARAVCLLSTKHFAAHVPAGRQVPVSVSMLDETPATWTIT